MVWSSMKNSSELRVFALVAMLSTFGAPHGTGETIPSKRMRREDPAPGLSWEGEIVMSVCQEFCEMD